MEPKLTSIGWVARRKGGTPGRFGGSGPGSVYSSRAKAIGFRKWGGASEEAVLARWDILEVFVKEPE